jgi:hypothetical protein
LFLEFFYKIIGQLLFEEVENKESPNSRPVDKIPSTFGFHSQMLQVKDGGTNFTCGY